MAVRQRGDSWQSDFRWQGDRVRETHPTAEAAAQFEADSLTGLKVGTLMVVRGKVRPVTPQNVAAGGEPKSMKWLAQLTHDTVWKGTSNAKLALGNAKRVAVHLGESKHPSVAITALAVRQMVADMHDRGKAAATINRHLSALARMIEVANEIDMEVNLPKGLPWQDEKGNARSREFTKDEEAAILDAFEQMEHRDMRDLFICLIDTGMRLGEATRLTVLDVPKIEAGEFIHLIGSRRSTGQRTKNGESRSVPMTIRVAETLQSRKAAMPVGETRFFWTLNDDYAQKLWSRMRTKLGKDDDNEFVMHVARHTFASRLARTGASSLQLMEVGGWKSETMVKRYGHLTPSDSRTLIARLNPKIG